MSQDIYCRNEISYCGKSRDSSEKTSPELSSKARACDQWHILVRSPLLFPLGVASIYRPTFRYGPRLRPHRVDAGMVSASTKWRYWS